MQSHVIRAIVRKELAGYFTHPVGYVFITLFVFLSGLAAFWAPGFFERNLANLDQLNNWFPVLLLFLIPAITMASWAEERRQGTEELLLTLPASEFELALGKYLGCVAIYAVCLLFALGHVGVLLFLGRPDLGLTASTFLAYLLAGSALCAVGLAASSLAGSATVSYIGGALACFAFVGVGVLPRAIPGGVVADVARAVDLPLRMEAMCRGVIDAADVLYFVGVAALGLALSVAVITARRRAGGAGGAAAAARALHWPVRGAALVAALAFAVILIDRTALRADATAERLWSLSPQTRQLLRELPADRSILITAYVSPTVPESHVQQRETLLGLLREFGSLSGGKVQTRVVETRPNTEEAREAERNFGIRPRPLPADTGSVGAVEPVFMGLAFTGGTSEPSVLEFLGRGLNAEYELVRGVRAAGAGARKKIGVLETPAGLLGSFDFQTMQSRPDWPIVADLRRQYQVVKVAAGADYPKDLDVLIAAQPSALATPELERLIAHVNTGKATIILEDPFPFVNPTIATNEPRRPASPFGGPPPEPKANLKPLWDALGASVPGDAVVWDAANPHPELGQAPKEFVFVSRAAAGEAVRAGAPPINDDDPITSGLQEVVLLMGGRIERVEAPPPAPPAKEGETAAPPAPPAAKPTNFVTLLRSSPKSGQVLYADLLQRGPFGLGGFNPARRPVAVGSPRSMAARLTGGTNNINVLLIADLDMISEEFFSIRERGLAGMEFDNVTFVLNAVDQLAGEQSLLELRKKRRVFRTLERVELRRREEQLVTQAAVDTANRDAESRLADARQRFDAKLKEIEDRQDLDATTKQIMAESVRQAEQRRLDISTAAVEDQKRQRIQDAQLATQESIDRIQTSIRVAALALPPVPALLVGLAVMARRRQVESATVRKAEGE